MTELLTDDGSADEPVPRCVVCGHLITGESMQIRGIYGVGLAHKGYTDCVIEGDPYA